MEATIQTEHYTVTVSCQGDYNPTIATDICDRAIRLMQETHTYVTAMTTPPATTPVEGA